MNNIHFVFSRKLSLFCRSHPCIRPSPSNLLVDRSIYIAYLHNMQVIFL